MSDRQRVKEIYTYLFYLAAKYKSQDRQRSEKERINFRQTSIRLGFGEKSDYAYGVYNLITDNAVDTRYPIPSALTTGELVERIQAIRAILEEEYKKDESGEFPKTLKQKDIQTLLGYLVSLSPQEKEQLGLIRSEAEAILQQALLNISSYDTEEEKYAILQLYKTSIGLNKEQIITANSQIDSIPEFITEVTQDYFNILGLSEWKNREAKQKDLSEHIYRRLLRIESQAGIGEVQYQSVNDQIATQFKKDYFTKNFLEKLIYSTIDNYLIRESIPLYFQYANIDEIPPLPLFYQNQDNSDQEDKEGLLNPEIIEPDQDPNNTGLASQYSYKVTVSFNLKIEDNNFLKKIREELPPEVKRRLIKSGKTGLVFTVTSLGVGGQMSQLIKVINRALFWDIKCIRKSYFPIANDLFINQEIINNRMESPMWSHSLVRLCRLDYLKTALQQEKYYDECTHIDEISKGDYCGFNFIEAIVKSAIQARLAAILKTNIDPFEYIEDLSKTIKEREILRVAQDYLDYYPFSLKAMESYLECHLLNQNSDEKDVSYLTDDAYFAIIKAYLREGLYRQAYEYLQKVKSLEKFSQQDLPDENFEICSGAALVKYELCKANYFYLCDEQDTKKEYRWENLPEYSRGEFINQVWKSLENATKHIKIRMAKYSTIKEISQSIFHPHFILLAQINFLKAKLFLFFPSYAVNKIDKTNILKNYDYHYARIYLLEKSRIYAAKNSYTVTYACYTAYQVWAYIMTGYLVNKKQEINFTINNNSKDKILKEVDFRKDNCLNWAKRLMDHALISYEEFGRQCYYQIKEKSGTSGNTSYGNFCIEKLPLIQEEQEENKQGYKDNILHIDMSLLSMKTLDNDNTELEKYIYLFGAKAAILLFARGMYTLCGNENTNSLEEWKAKIHKAYRLFNYAWGIAEDGCETPSLTEESCEIKNPCDDEDKNTIGRKFKPDNNDNYPPLEVQTVRDIYPHRQTEIADLGKVFAIACLLLKLYLTKSKSEKVMRKKDINNLREHFHDISRSKKELVANQPRFNGHLAAYLNKIKWLIDQELEEINNTKISPDETGIKKIRQRIMVKFFESFYNTVVPSKE